MMKPSQLTLVTLLACYVTGQGQAEPEAYTVLGQVVTLTEVKAMKSAITEQLRASINPDATNERGFAFSLAADYVRLTFHTCPGRCTGCLNLRQKGSEGLETAIYLLWNLYKDVEVYYSSTSRDILRSFADFVALAAITAAEFTAELQTCAPDRPGCLIPRPQLAFRTGREDCYSGLSEGPFEDRVRVFPEPHDGFEKTVGYFKQQYGMTADETVAALGAHTLGFCSQHHSGYLGAWVSDVSRLDNDYYKVLVDPAMRWTQRNIQPNPDRKKFFQWNPDTGNPATDALMMLNVDIGLLIDLKVNAEGASSCSISTCGASPGAALVQLYAEDNDRWMTDFSAAFQKIIDNGYKAGDLRLPIPFPYTGRREASAGQLSGGCGRDGGGCTSSGGSLARAQTTIIVFLVVFFRLLRVAF